MRFSTLLVQTKNTRRGFTIVETLVAVTILIIILVALMSSVKSGINYFIYSKEQVTAFYLVNDAMEYIKNIRAHDLYERRVMMDSGSAFNDTVLTAGNCDGANGCILDSTTGAFSPCSTSPCERLLQDTSGGSASYAYQYATGTESPFRRTIFVSNSGDEIIVTVLLEWETGGIGSGSYSLTRVFYDFYNVL